MTTGSTYKVVELVGTSSEGIDQAIEGAIARAGQMKGLDWFEVKEIRGQIQGLDWFEVKEIRGQIQDGKMAWYQVKLGIGFRVLDPADLHRE